MKTNMNWVPYASTVALAFGATLAPMTVHSKIYVSIEQAQQLIFGAEHLTLQPIVLTRETQEKMRQASSVAHPFQSGRIWRTSTGGWFIVDEVIGKHEMITYAVGVNPDGSVRQIEILEYKETYGYEVAEPAWRNQFVGKTADSTLKLNQDIENISGATLSAKHLTDGVKRVMVMVGLALKASD